MPTLYDVVSMAVRAAERDRRARDRARRASERQSLNSRAAEADEQSAELAQRVQELSSLMIDSLDQQPRVDFHALKQPLLPEVFKPGKLAAPEPKPEESRYQPPPLNLLQRLIPARRRDHERAVHEAQIRFESDLIDHSRREAARLRALEEAKIAFGQAVRRKELEVAEQHAAIETFEEEVAQGVPHALSKYFEVLLETREYPEGFPQEVKAAFLPESAQLVVEYRLPTIDVVPELVGYKYVKARGEIVGQPRPQSKRRSLYASTVAQVVLRSVREIFDSQEGSRVGCVVLNGYVDTADPGTGKPIRPCLISLRTTRDVFSQIDLTKVEPLACLKVLNAAVSKSPSELAPVRPILEFKMVDPRFVPGSDVLSELDQRPNLMDLSPNEFEALISNLFERMGLETRQTRPSRDGGVDCVAYDPRPILGGKVVIQAKRYKHTVGVSAVRDLFGTLQNEGASKGILVTTSGYGRAAFDFAEGKPIELISGSNLLYLLAEHAGLEARIVVPDDWRDPALDSPDEDASANISSSDV